MSDPVTGFVSTLIRDTTPTLEAEVTSNPMLIKSDGKNVTYACNVRLIDYGDTELKAVPIATANESIAYAIGVGCAVSLSRSPATGKMEITGFCKRKPGRFRTKAVDLSTGVADPTVDLTLTVRPLTFGELKDYGGGFGFCPFGACAVFKGGIFVEVRG